MKTEKTETNNKHSINRQTIKAMKKSYLLIAAAAIFAACAETDLISDFGSNDVVAESAIGFGSGMNNMTKAENSKADDQNGLENFWWTMRIWGYKNIRNLGEENYTSTAVFNSDKSNVLYNRSTALWKPSGLATPFYTTKGDWYYSPVRYWDKTATYYDFHAAAPDTLPGSEALNWEWHQVMANGTSWDPDKADGEGAGYFTLKNFQLNGESLPMAKSTPVNGTEAVFGGKMQPQEGWETKDIDLMIATDVVRHDPKSHTNSKNDRINFDFNHILSRLNIGVKIGENVAVKYKKDGSGNDDLTNPTEGIVLLGRVEIVGLNTKGNFDEGVLVFPQKAGTAMNGSTTFVTADSLKKGTAMRWNSNKATVTAADGAYSTYGFPNEKVNGKLYQNNTDEQGDTLNLTKQFNDIFDNSISYGKNDFKMIFQGLVIPQNVEYEEMPLDGSTITDSSKPYLKISYSLDGEKFTNYYNLAAIFRNSTEESTIAFCEGWQNNLWITINPTAILFDAEVYQWETYKDSGDPNLTVE